MLQFSTRSIELISLEQASPSVKIRVSFDKTGIDSTSTQDLYSQNSTFESDLIVVRIKVTVDGKKLKLDEELGLIETIRNWFEEVSKRGTS